MKKFDLGELLFNIIAVTGGISTVYGFIEKSPYKIIWIIAGIILIGIYLRWYVNNYLTKNLEENKKYFESKMNEFSNKLQEIKEELSFIKGWMNAINHFKNKKGTAINPIVLLIIIIIIILLILYSQGRL